MNDPIDNILQQWNQTKPELDCSAMGIVGRLLLVNINWKKKIEHVLTEKELSFIEFDILATLRRNQIPLTPTELYQTLMLSSGAMSTRIETLVQRGFIERVASEKDRRSCKVKLTPQGIKAIDIVLDAHVKNMSAMLNGLNGAEQKQLAGLLKKVLLSN